MKHSTFQFVKHHTHALFNGISLLLDATISRLQFKQLAKTPRHPPQNSIQNT